MRGTNCPKRKRTCDCRFPDHIPEATIARDRYNNNDRDSVKEEEIEEEFRSRFPQSRHCVKNQ
jgi:hypothetical protein